MNIEEANAMLIKQNFNNRVSSSNELHSNINYELINSLVEYRKIFGPPTTTELERHHNSTKEFVRTVTPIKD